MRPNLHSLAPLLLCVMTLAFPACGGGGGEAPATADDGGAEKGDAGAETETEAATAEPSGPGDITCPEGGERVEKTTKSGTTLVYCDVNGNKLGPGVELYKSGRLFRTGKYEKGRKVGEWVGYWNKDGEVLRATAVWENGKRHGEFIAYHEDGTTLREQGMYEKGKKVGEWVEGHANGETKAKGSYEAGKRSGLWTLFYEDGKKKSEAIFARGKREGAGTRYHPDGETVAASGLWSKGKRTGEWKRYDESGKALDPELCDPSCKD